MKLPIPFFKKKKIENNFYLALLLIEEKVASAILEEEAGKLKIVGTHNEKLSSSYASMPQEELIKIIDRVISRSEESLPPSIETHKTVFGVNEEWVEKESKKIKKEHLIRLKNISDKLDLTPIGFIVIHEAIINLLQSEEGNPLSAILANIGKDSINLMLIRGGQVTESSTGKINDSIAITVDNLLKNFTAPVLPSRLIVVNTKETDKASHDLNNHQWSKSLPFLHVPQISILPEDFDLKAIIFGSATQLGFDVLGLHALDQEDYHKKLTHEEKNTPSEDEKMEKDVPKIDDDKNFGFVIDEDIANSDQLKKSVATHSEKTSPKINIEGNKDESSDFGNQNINFPDEEPDNYFPEDRFEDSQESNKKNIISNIMSFISTISLPKTAHLLDIFKTRRKLKLIAVAVVALLVLITVFGAIYVNNSKAEIILTVKPNEVTEEEEVVFSTNSSSDFAEKIISAQSISAEVKGELTTATTGKKDVGENATGTVTIYNSGNTRVTLNSGTEITSSNGLAFTLNDNISIASASGDIFSGTTPGTADVKVEAKEIGTESNLPSGTKFTIGGNNSLAAKNDSAFSGGTKKNVKVVSDKDLSKLKSDLEKQLEKDGREALSEKIEGGEEILPLIVDASFEEERFDKKVNDEADNVKLTATISFIGASYSKDQVNEFVKSLLKDTHSEDIVFADDSIKVEIKNSEVENENEIRALLNIKAGLLPEIKKSEVIEKLKSKSPKEAREILNSLPQVEKTEIKFYPNIFLISNLFPKLPKNLEITLNAR
jgi:hypothetical protein